MHIKHIFHISSNLLARPYLRPNLSPPFRLSPVSLSALCAGIQLAVEESLPDVYWVMAEIAELTAHRNGHC